MTNKVQKRGLEWIVGSGEPVIVDCTVPASDGAVLGIGDPVKITAMAADGKYTVTRTTAGGGIDGIVVNPKRFPYTYTDTDGRRTASVLSTVSVMLVNPGDGKQFRMEASTDADFAVANFATTRYCDLATVGNADSVTAYSTVEVNLNSAHASQGDVYILSIDPTYGDVNDIGTNTKVIVKIANT